MKHLATGRDKYLVPVALCFAILFHTSYSSILFIGISQLLWLYRMDDRSGKPRLSSFLRVNGITLLFCLPWVLFLAFHYKGQGLMDPLTDQNIGSLRSLTEAVFNDWVPFLPLMIVSGILMVLFAVFAILVDRMWNKLPSENPAAYQEPALDDHGPVSHPDLVLEG